MKIGVDSFSLHPLELDVFGQLAFAARLGFEGLHGGVDLDEGIERLADVRAEAACLGLYTEVGLGIINPCTADCSREELQARVTRQIEHAAACGWHELHAVLGSSKERFSSTVPWTRQLESAAELLAALTPVLRAHGSRVNLETHGDATTFELVRLVEQVGPAYAGICLDTANVLCHAEDPVLAADRAAPYTHMTHIKDAIMFFTETGLRRQTQPVGRGAIDWPAVLPLLAARAPGIHLSIEDHKWLFDANIFDERWLAFHPDLTREELARVVRIAWQCQQRIDTGDLVEPARYETIPYKDELEERLTIGQKNLRRYVTHRAAPADERASA